MSIQFKYALPTSRASVAEFTAVALSDKPVLDIALKGFDERIGGALQRALESRQFRGARDEQLQVTGTNGVRVLLIGIGVAVDRSTALRRAASISARQASKIGVTSAVFYGGETGPKEVESIVIGFIAGAWSYKELKSPTPDNENRPELEQVTVITTDIAAAAAIANGEAMGAGQSLARRLAMMPGNLCTPDYLASTAAEIGQRHGMTVTTLGRADMEAQGMGSFLAVAQATPQDPKLITLEYRGAGNDTAPIVLIGKGLCFDSGGISIKPAQGMEYMKFDMCGGAGVLGAMEVIGRLKLKINVVGIVGATTNMPSGTAMNPGDVVRSHFGKTIEIINTDAEGRLVLADLLSYARKFKPAAVIDAATLTGACVIALGHTATAVFGTDDFLITEVLAAAKRAGEPGWSLPLWDEYHDLIKSDVADMKNSGGRPAGSISAAMFLKEFVEGYPWVHLDIAGTAYSESDLVAIPKGPTGVPVGTFVEFVRGRVS